MFLMNYQLCHYLNFEEIKLSRKCFFTFEFKLILSEVLNVCIPL